MFCGLGIKSASNPFPRCAFLWDYLVNGGIFINKTGYLLRSMGINRRVEAMPHLESMADETVEPWRRSARAKLFGLVVGLTLVTGVALTLFQPTVYRSSATVLMSAPRAIDAEAAQADIQNVAIQRRILLGKEITRRLAAELNVTDALMINGAELGQLLRVEPLLDTNLVEMSAQGEDGALLPRLVDAWIDVYLAARAEEVERSKQQTLQVVQEELGGLAAKLEKARAALDEYRQEHEIISAERQENEVLARLDGLNKALNNAIEEEAKTRAYLDTLRLAIARGAQVVPKGDRRVVEELDKELRELQGQMLELSKRYTPEYIEKQPRWRAIPVRIEELQAELARVVGQGRDAELASAIHAHEAASQTVSDLQRKLDQHKQDVARFSSIYSTHQALVEDLARLEEVNRETQTRLVRVEVRQVEKYPQVSVIDRPQSESERIGPDYLLWLGGTLSAALGLGILSVWLYGFLSPRNAQPGYVTLSGVHLYPQEVSGQLGYQTQPDPRLEQDRNPRLEKQPYDEATDDTDRENENGQRRPD